MSWKEPIGTSNFAAIPLHQIWYSVTAINMKFSLTSSVLNLIAISDIIFDKIITDVAGYEKYY